MEYKEKQHMPMKCMNIRRAHTDLRLHNRPNKWNLPHHHGNRGWMKQNAGAKLQHIGKIVLFQDSQASLEGKNL